MYDYLFDVNKNVQLCKTVSDQSIQNCRIDTDQTFAWLVNDTEIQIFLISNGSKVLQFDFKNFADDMRITDIIQYKISIEKSLLLIGLSSDSNNSKLLLFDIQKMKVLRYFRLKYNIMKLCKVNEWLERQLYQFQQFMNEVIIVGTEQGLIHLIDLNLDFVYSTYQYAPLEHSLEFLTKENVKNGMPIKNIHYSVIINEDYIVNSNFICWINNDRNETIEIDSQNVSVSALEYCESIRGLFVGFNFGLWQIWSLETLTVLYSSHISSESCPVSHFAFMEPVDDPKQFCYFWVVFSDNELLKTSPVPKAFLFSLLFNDKIKDGTNNYRYKSILKCMYRLQFDLDGMNKKVSGGICLSTNIINRIIDDNQIILCSFVWRTADKQFNEFNTHFLLFDLNQWYKDEMPNSINYRNLMEYNGAVNFMWYFNMSSVIKRLLNTDNIFVISDLRIDPRTVIEFKQSRYQYEEFYYPSALYFEFNCLSESRILKMVHRGVQNSVLHKIKISEPHFLWNPQEMFLQCLRVALLNTPRGNMDLDEIEIDTQRNLIMTLALENKMINWLIQCAKNWALGTYSNFGCSLNGFSNWVYNHIKYTRDFANESVNSLMFGSQNHNDTIELRKRLTQSRVELFNLEMICTQIMKQLCNTLTNSEYHHLAEQNAVLEALGTYYKCIEWCSFHGVIPEYLLHFDDFVQYHRTWLKKQTSRTLFIEKFIEKEFDKNIMKDDWLTSDEQKYYYQPNDFQIILHIYLKPVPNILNKHIVFLYCLIDILKFLNTREKIDWTMLLRSFITFFGIEKTIERFVLGFWFMDHGFYEDALKEFIQPWVKLNEIDIWYHRFIVSEFIKNNKYALALKYFKIVNISFEKDEDHFLMISLLVSERSVSDAYFYQCKYRNDQNVKALLVHFFKECEKQNKIDQLIKISLNKFEESLFLKYCLNCVKKELYIPYFIQHNRILEIIELKKKFVENRLNCYGSDKNMPTALIMIENYLKTLPSTINTLINVYVENENDFEKKLDSPMRSLSKITNSNLIHTDYKSSFQYALLVETKKVNLKSDSSKNISLNFIPFLSDTFVDSDDKWSQLCISKHNVQEVEKKRSNKTFLDNAELSIKNLLNVPYFKKSQEFSAKSHHKHSQGILKTVTDTDYASKEIRFMSPNRNSRESSISEGTSAIASKILASSNSSSNDIEKFLVARKTQVRKQPSILKKMEKQSGNVSDISGSSLYDIEINRPPVNETEQLRSENSTSDMDVEIKTPDRQSRASSIHTIDSRKSKSPSIEQSSYVSNSDMDIDIAATSIENMSPNSSIKSKFIMSSSSLSLNSDAESGVFKMTKRLRQSNSTNRDEGEEFSTKKMKSKLSNVTKEFKACYSKSLSVTNNSRLQKKSISPNLVLNLDEEHEVSSENNKGIGTEDSNINSEKETSERSNELIIQTTNLQNEAENVNEIMNLSGAQNRRSSIRLREKYLQDEKRKEIEKWAFNSSQHNKYPLKKRKARSQSMGPNTESEGVPIRNFRTRCKSLEPSNSIKKRRNSIGSNSKKNIKNSLRKSTALQTIQEDFEIGETSSSKAKNPSSSNTSSVYEPDSEIYKTDDALNSDESSLIDQVFARKKLSTKVKKTGKLRRSLSVNTINSENSESIQMNDDSDVENYSNSILTEEQSINSHNVSDNSDSESVISISSSKSKAISSVSSAPTRRSTRSSSLKAQSILKTMK